MGKILILMFAVMLVSTSALAETVRVSVNGMVCAFCVQSITSKVQAHDEVASVDVNLDKKLVSIFLKDGKSLGDEAIKEAIKDAGYAVTSIERGK